MRGGLWFCVPGVFNDRYFVRVWSSANNLSVLHKGVIHEGSGMRDTQRDLFALPPSPFPCLPVSLFSRYWANKTALQEQRQFLNWDSIWDEIEFGACKSRRVDSHFGLCILLAETSDCKSHIKLNKILREILYILLWDYEIVQERLVGNRVISYTG